MHDNSLFILLLLFTFSDSQPLWFILTMNYYHCFVTDQTKETRDETIISHDYPLYSEKSSGLNEANECKNCLIWVSRSGCMTLMFH